MGYQNHPDTRFRNNILLVHPLCTSHSMVDVKDDMNNDTESYGGANASDPKNVQELTQYVQSLLQTIQDKFQNMSDQILTRIDEMGTRIDDLEKNIGDLMTQAGVEGAEK